MCDPLKWLESFATETPVPGACSSYGGYCLAVSVLLFDITGDLYLVHPTKAERTVFVPPQTTVRPEDKTLEGAIRRCLKNKLGLEPGNIALHPAALAHYLNIVPARRETPGRVKGIIVFAGVLTPGTQFRLNRREVNRVEPVAPELLASRLPQGRDAKCRGTCRACLEATTQGLLSHHLQQRYLRALGSPDP
jgi:hypothetical protein